jgi:hypothetical protein
MGRIILFVEAIALMAENLQMPDHESKIALRCASFLADEYMTGRFDTEEQKDRLGAVIRDMVEREWKECP